MTDGEEETNSKFCCRVKEFYSKESKLISTLEITPRHVLIKKNLKPNEEYSEIILIKNNGNYPRPLKYRTNCEDTEIKIHGIPKIQYLKPNVSIHLEVIICPKTLKGNNCVRRLYIDSEHPNITFEIPIIVLPKAAGPILPQEIEFPRSIPKSKTYYEFIIYNAAREEASFNIRSYSNALTFNSNSSKVKPKEFARVFLRLKVKDICPSQGFLKIRFGPCVLPVEFIHKPKPISLFVSTPLLEFEETKLDRSTLKSFTVCNDGNSAVPFSFEFEEGFQHLALNTVTSNEVNEDNVEDGSYSNDSGASFVSLTYLKDIDPLSKMMKISKNLVQNLRRNDNKHFKIDPKEGEFLPNSCTRINVIFNPSSKYADFDADMSPPFTAQTEIKLNTPNSDDHKDSVVASGLIEGPDVFISPKVIDFRQVFLGEEHCEEIRITNTDGVCNVKIDFYDHSGSAMAKVFMTPKKGLFLQPCQQDVFHFTFYTIIIGKIYFKIRFKINNGKFLTVVVKADSQPVRVKSFPELVEFGSVPFGVPQKRHVLLMNPLSVPISFQCFVEDNGTEIPLVLNVDNVNELPPVDIKNPIENILAMQDEDNISAYNMNNLPNCCSEEDISYNSLNIDNEDSSICSSTFRNDVIEHIEDIAVKVVNTIKVKRVQEKNEPETKIVRVAANELLALPYFEDLTRYNNYACMDWDAIPSDPCELYFDSEMIHLKPNAGRSLTVLIIPNTPGYFNRAISIRSCPHIPCGETEEYDHTNPSEMLCDSSLLITRLYVEYNCRIPQIKFETEIDFSDGEIYAMQVYDFEMEFENQSNIGGFLHFVLVPNCEMGVMRFRRNHWKFFINPEDFETAYCTVQFKRTGDITLSGLLKIVGQALGIPFHLSAHVLPTRVSLQPTSINKRQEVLETTYVTVFITNLTPTITGFILSLRDERYQSLDTYGAQLGPHKQGTYVVIRTMYPDPGIYKNILYIDMLYGKILEVPVTYNVTGMPVFFDPDLRKDFDAGTIILTSEQEYESRNTNYSKIVRIWNEGERPYSVTFQKIKGNSDSNVSGHCKVETLKAQFFINPKTVLLLPGGVAFVEITAVGCKEAMIYSEFRVTVVDQTNSTRFMNLRFVLKGKFAPPELLWNPRKLYMTYNRTHKFLEHPQMEIVELTNNRNAPMTNVTLEVCGPFKIKKLYEHPFTKKIDMDLQPLERKEITVLLNKNQLLKENTRRYPLIKAQIYTYVNNSMQKSLPILLEINCPDIVIVESEVVLFTGFKEDFTEIILENIGLLEAYYKWKKIGESEVYVGETDDSAELARNLLNDLLRMLELHGSYDLTNDLVCQENLTKCYQKYRCLLKDTPLADPIGVADIIDEIITNLDLEHKRYAARLDEPEDDVCSHSTENDFPCAERSVKETMDALLNNLKLEDSFIVSEPSEEECDRRNHFYFCKKDGIVQPKRGSRCLLHLPPVKEGYALTASFELDVVGGKPQNLTVTLVNLKRAVQFIPDSYFLGVKPWYECCLASIGVNNTTPYRVNVEVLNRSEIKRNNLHLVQGYAEITTPKIFYMKPYGINRIRTEGIMGFSDEFIRDIKFIICDRNVTSFRLRGQGIMPILLATGTKIYPRIDQTQNEIIEEYKTLQKIYYFAMFKDITYVDEEMEHCIEEEEAMKKKLKEPSFILFEELSLSDDGAESARTSTLLLNERIWQLLLSTYVVAYNDSSLPNATILDQLINMVKFKQRLYKCAKTRETLKLVFQDHVKMLCTYDEKMPLNLKYFIVQPLPYEQLGYIVEMTDLKLNQFRRYQIELQFLGPGKLTASARTAVNIPGLYVHFEVYDKNPCEEFELYRAEEKIPDFYVRKYRNMWERQIDREMDPKLHKAHSFDCEERCKAHKREILTMTAKNRKDINNYYNSLNKSVYVENKHHFINCTIFAKSKMNFSGALLRVHILLRPDSKYFTEGQVFEDYLYIDLHMGPTLPILMRGLIK